MKKRLVVIALVATALVAPTNTALADAQTDYQLALQQYQTELTNWSVTVKAEQENFQVVMQNWVTAVKAAEQARKDIASKFKTDADAIKERTIAVVTAAATAKEKKVANAAAKRELDLVIAVRNTALEAVVKPGMKPSKPKPAPAPTPPAKPAPPAPPVKPIKPIKPIKPMKPSKSPAVTKSPTG